MKELLKEPLSYVFAYMLIGIFTFGHAWHSVPDAEKAQFAGIEYTIHNGPGTKFMAGFACSLAWPLYWSVKVQEK
jgi:hypothetical protein